MKRDLRKELSPFYAPSAKQVQVVKKLRTILRQPVEKVVG
jgi:hypothetical protein